MKIAKGGRGKKMPYQCQSVNVPTMTVDIVKEISETTKHLLTEGRQNELQAYLDALKDAKTALEEDGLQG